MGVHAGGGGLAMKVGDNIKLIWHGTEIEVVIKKIEKEVLTVE
jgi:hypothetical protein